MSLSLANDQAVMNLVDLQRVADAVTRRAAEQGYLLPREVREEVVSAGAEASLWKDVLKLASPQLVHRKGRYFYVSPASPQRQSAERRTEAIHAAVHELVVEYRQAAELQERRETDRLTFFQQVTVETSDGQVHRVLSKDISASGIRLLGTKGLLGQKLRVTVPSVEGPARTFVVRILWTCMVGDELYENGGSFVELVK
jgi:hypothetical protein